MADKGSDEARQAGRTLWDKANDFSKIVRCVVCDRLLEPPTDADCWVLIGGRGWPRSSHGMTIHRGCLEAGRAQAIREGLSWSVQHGDRPDSSEPAPTDSVQSEPECFHDSCMHVVARMEALAALIEASEEELEVCPCDCHASCPLAALETVTEVTLRKSCTCPGSEDAKRFSQIGRMRSRQRPRGSPRRRNPSHRSDLHKPI